MPLDPAAYASVLEWGPADMSLLRDLRDDLVASGGVGADHLLMGLTCQDKAPDQVYRRALDEATAVAFLPMHCNAPGEVVGDVLAEGS